MKNVGLLVALALVGAALVLIGRVDVAAHQGFENCAPGNVADDDGDTIVNDGCPIVGTQGEDFEQCAVWNTWDDDGDTVVNDGCAGNPTPAGPLGQPEVTNTCRNNTDDDNMDGYINDGCPAVGAAEIACQDNLDNDGDRYVNDGCPVVLPPTPRAGDQSEGSAGTTSTPVPPTPWPADTNQCDEPVGSVIDNDADGDGPPWPTTKYNDGCPAPVGGMQALPDPATDTGSSDSLLYAAIAGAGLAAAVVITGSGWYARRRWLR
jgi:hypothetical protein